MIISSNITFESSIFTKMIISTYSHVYVHCEYEKKKYIYFIRRLQKKLEERRYFFYVKTSCNQNNRYKKLSVPIHTKVDVSVF